MYTLNKGPSKIVFQTRRGLGQNFQKFETIKEGNKTNGSSDLNSPEEPTNIPRPVFQKPKADSLALNRIASTFTLNANPVITPHHEEIVRYIKDSWNTLIAEDPHGPGIKGDNIIVSSPAAYFEAVYIEPPSPELKGFRPFNLEAWWGQRLFQSITENI